jgi:hypothetical protein
MKHSILAGIIAAAALVGWPRAQQPPPQPPPTTQQPSEIGATIGSEAGGPPRLAVPDFIALSTDAETVAIAKILGQVLWDDLNFEHEFAFIPRDVYASIPKATSLRRRAVRSLARVERRRPRRRHRAESGCRRQGRSASVRRTQRAGRCSGKEYSGGAAANPRRYAHMVSDDLHLSQRALTAWRRPG